MFGESREAVWQAEQAAEEVGKADSSRASGPLGIATEKGLIGTTGVVPFPKPNE
jgi:hypothetical protein